MEIRDVTLQLFNSRDILAKIKNCVSCLYVYIYIYGTFFLVI